MASKFALPRQATLLDLIVLIAATAFGAQALRGCWTILNVSHLASSLDRSPGLYWLVRAPHAIGAAAPVVAAWTVATFGLGLRRIRRTRHFSTQPGMAACAAATLALVGVAVDSVVQTAVFAPITDTFPGWRRFPEWLPVARRFQLKLIGDPSRVGLAVAAVWFWLILSGRWRPQPTWFDRLGRALGVYWVVMILWTHLLEWLMINKIFTIA